MCHHPVKRSARKVIIEAELKRRAREYDSNDDRAYFIGVKSVQNFLQERTGTPQDYQNTYNLLMDIVRSPEFDRDVDPKDKRKIYFWHDPDIARKEKIKSLLREMEMLKNLLQQELPENKQIRVFLARRKGE